MSDNKLILKYKINDSEINYEFDCSCNVGMKGINLLNITDIKIYTDKKNYKKPVIIIIFESNGKYISTTTCNSSIQSIEIYLYGEKKKRSLIKLKKD